MVKVLFLNNFNYLRGGSEKVMFEEMGLLRQAGHEVAVFSRTHHKNEPAEFQKFFPPHIETERLSPTMRSLGVVKELIYSKAARKGVGEVLKRFRPEIVHAHNIYGRLSLSVLDELRAAGIPVIMTLHDLKLLCPSYLMLNRGKVCERCRGGRFYQAVLARCHKKSLPASLVYAFESYINHSKGKYCSVAQFITPSRFLRDKCIEYGWAAEKISHIHNFLPLNPVSGMKGDNGYLLYIGRLSREKGIGTLLEAYRGLSPAPPLKIVGDGPERPSLEKHARELGLPVSFAGYLSGTDLDNAVAGARGVVMPSEWYENAPLSLLESFAAGKPVIGARIGGIPEMIEDDVNGYLFEPGNSEALRCKIEAFVDMPAARLREMGEAARRKVETVYSAESHYEKLMNVYEKAMGSSCA